MRNVFRAELATLLRRRVFVGALLASIAFVAVTSLAVFASAEAAGGPTQDGAPTIQALSAAGGGTEAFSSGIGFVGLFVMVAFITRLAGEFSHGTLRTLLMKEPRRLRVVLGKMMALLAFMATVLLLAEALTFAASVLMAPGQDVDTSAWYGLDSSRAAAGDYVAAFLGLSAWGFYGMTLALIIRSVPIAVGVGVAWAGPLEHITEQSWQTATRWFPGLQLEALVAGGTGDVSYERAILLTSVYVALAVTIALFTLTRRDVTG